MSAIQDNYKEIAREPSNYRRNTKQNTFVILQQPVAELGHV